MYGVAGERRLAEWEADWLPGYEDSAPVRIGNAAVDQRQLDVYGEVIDALTLGSQAGLRFDEPHLEPGAAAARLPGEALGRARRGHLGGARAPRHFVHSKVMAWVAFDRAIHLAEQGKPGADDALARDPRPDPRRGLRAGLRRQARHVHPVLRQHRARRGGAADPGGRVPAAGRPAGGLHRADHQARADARRPGAALHPADRRQRRPDRRRRPAPAPRARSSPAASGWSTRCT